MFTDKIMIVSLYVFRTTDGIIWVILVTKMRRYNALPKFNETKHDNGPQTETSHYLYTYIPASCMYLERSQVDVEHRGARTWTGPINVPKVIRPSCLHAGRKYGDKLALHAYWLPHNVPTHAVQHLAWPRRVATTSSEKVSRSFKSGIQKWTWTPMTQFRVVTGWKKGGWNPPYVSQYQLHSSTTVAAVEEHCTNNTHRIGWCILCKITLWCGIVLQSISLRNLGGYDIRQQGCQVT